jgi:hypothetical protein
MALGYTKANSFSETSIPASLTKVEDFSTAFIVF